MGSREWRAPLIESIANPTVRMLRELHGRDGRREHCAFLIEGVRLVAEALSASWPLLAALYDPSRAEGGLSSLVARIPSALPASPRVLKHACDTVTPQGIVAAARMPAFEGPADPAEPLVLVMDGIADPGNAGTLLRSALASGVRTVLVSPGTVDPYAPKVVRSGMGAHFHLRLGVNLPWPDLLSTLGDDRPMVVAEAGAELPYYRFDWRRPTALLVGGEAHGPSLEALKRAASRVSIPLAAGVESLNAAVAGSVILFEGKRQRETGE